jgi:hypothetical protein
MFYRSITGTWIAEQSINQHDRSSSPDPNSDAYASLINHLHNIPLQEHETSAPNDEAPNNPPILSEFPNISAEEAYHHFVYNAVFTPDTLPAALPKQSAFSTFWPTFSDLEIRRQNARLGKQKLLELRTHYASDDDLKRAILTYSIMVKQKKLPGPPATAIFAKLQPLNREVTILGWIGWIYAAIYAPISQIIWVVSNVSADSSSGVAKIVKGITVAVTALPLCLDSRVRFADSLTTKRCGGTWAYYTFNLTNSLSCLFQGIICGALLIWGVVEARSQTDPFFASSFPWPLVAIYPIFSLIWAWASFALAPVMDGGRKRASQSHWTGYFVEVGMGAFAGLFLATPAFALYFSSADSGDGGTGAADLGRFLSCEVPGWQKFSAIFP